MTVAFYGISEDDAKLCDDFIERFTYTETFFQFDDWDVLFLSAYYHLPDNVPADWYNYDVNSPFYDAKMRRMQTYHLTNVKYIHKVHAAFTTVSYMINPRSLEKIYRLLLTGLNVPSPRDPQGRLTRAIDHILMNLQEEDRIQAYAVTPGMVTQRMVLSDIKGHIFDQNQYFSQVCGQHIYANGLDDFKYDEYFQLPSTDRWIIDYAYYHNDQWDHYVDGNGKPCHNIRLYNPTMNQLQYTLFFTSYFRQYFPTAKKIDQKTFQLNSHVISESNQILEYMNGFASDSIFIDVGGNCGLMCIPIGLQGYQTFTFEPVLENITCLRQSVTHNHVDNIVSIEPYALSDRVETKLIYVPKFKDNASLHQQAAVANLTDKTYREQVCQCLTFDQWLADHHQTIDASKIRLIKIDVQGFELPVLKGMHNFLDKAEDCHIIYETDENMSLLAGYQLTEIDKYLTDLGFTRMTYDTLPAYDQYISRIDYLLQGNALYVKKPRPRRIDLTDTTFIIPLRIDSHDRLENAEIVLNYLTHYFDTNIIVLENDKESHFADIQLNHPDEITHMFERTDNRVFHRTQLLNRMLSLVQTPVTVNYDIDVLLPPENYVIARNMILHEKYDAVYPFSNPHIQQLKRQGQMAIDRLQDAIDDIKHNHLIQRTCPCHPDENELFLSWKEDGNHQTLFEHIANKYQIKVDLLLHTCRKLEKQFQKPNHYNVTHMCFDQPMTYQYSFLSYGSPMLHLPVDPKRSNGVIYVPVERKCSLREQMSLGALTNMTLPTSSAGTGFAIFMNTQSYVLLGGENEDFISWGLEDQERTYKLSRLGYTLSPLYNDHLYELIDGHTRQETSVQCQIIPMFDSNFRGVYHLEHKRDINSSSLNPHFQHNEQLYNKIRDMSVPQLRHYYKQKHQEFMRKYRPALRHSLPSAWVTMLDIGLNGRLGNQMFQYAALVALAGKHNCALYLPVIQGQDGLNRLTLQRYFDLTFQPLFVITTNLASVTHKYRYDIIPCIEKKIGVYRESAFTYDPQLWVAECVGGLNVTGFFQSYKYVEQCQWQVFSFKSVVKQSGDRIIRGLRATYGATPLVACHIRRGDNTPGRGRQDIPHYVYNAKYIQKCFDVARETVGQDCVYVVFSDELEWCRDNVKTTGYSVEFLQGDNEGIDMYLMSSCDHVIISPSSFSWWGAYLNTSPQKQVFYPRPWFHQAHPELCHYKTHDLLPSTWIPIEITEEDHL